MNQTLLLITLFLLFSFPIHSQMPFRVIFYNVENLFDTIDDPDKDDNEFLPSGTRRWHPKRYYHKLQQIAKVINGVGEWDTPALIGLCEVENDTVIHHLLTRTPLYHQYYNYCITHSDDPRGMNVVLLYQRDKFRFLEQTNIRITFKNKKDRNSRDILHVSGKVISGDTLDVFICHFPSRYGGEKESEHKRISAASALKTYCDSLLSVRSFPHILIMGDMNDTPENNSIRKILNAYPIQRFTQKRDEKQVFYNLIPSFPKGIQGTHKYQGGWSQLDHMIINDQLLESSSKIQWVKNSCRIFAPSFLLTKDKTWKGIRPKRTYHGYKYEGGFSDHFPIIADFLVYLPEQE